MEKNEQELIKLVDEYVGIKVANWHQLDGFDATRLHHIYSDGSESYVDKGHFSVYDFVNIFNERYKLVEWGDAFQEDEELVNYMKNVELSSVKDYEHIIPKAPIKKYSVYKLVPYTVNGEPQW